jgi:iron complex transport system substrate-binding protein
MALDPHTFGETLDDVRTVAEATDSRAAGVELVAGTARRVDRVRLAVRARPRPRVVALEWLDPPFVAGHWTPQLIDLAGGEDVLGFSGEPSQTLSWEAIVATAPRVVVVMPCGYDAERGHAEAVAHTAELGALNAERIVAVNAAAYFSRPGPRLVDGLELLAHILHPTCVQAPAGAQALTVLD